MAARYPRRRRGIVRRLALWLVLAPLILTLLYTVIPPVSTLMLGRWLTFQNVERSWMPLEEISPNLVRAVVAAEDARFCGHAGVDWTAIRAVLREGGGDGPSRGASTISMQTAKNLFLWQGGAYLRKPLEIVLAHVLDFILSKRRLLEIYLNVVEWGPNGQFGAEAGVQEAFGEGAAALTPRQAALMATTLPNPILRNPAAPSRMHARAAARLEARTRFGRTDLSCVFDQ